MSDRVFSLSSAFLYVVVGWLLSFITLENIKNNWGLIELGIYFLVSIFIQGIISYMRICFLRYLNNKRVEKFCKSLKDMSSEELVSVLKKQLE